MRVRNDESCARSNYLWSSSDSPAALRSRDLQQTANEGGAKIEPAVGLVQAYLRLNGFFTVTEYPVMGIGQHGAYSLTDVDLLAVRFPNAQQWIGGKGHRGFGLENDPILEIEPHCIQMVIGEVKEGKPRLNENAITPRVIETVIRRFGCCEENPRDVAQRVVSHGRANTHVGVQECRIRMVVFAGGDPEPAPATYDVIGLRHIVEYLNDFVHRHSDVFLSSQIKDESFDMMALLVKLGVRI
ncbi:MAG: hypothetical protein AKCLJLPJ_01499 [Fimbriimonadales bacterium]|nr:MAG: hypothetical protein EDM73_07545 [Armatimonadota bacterium]MBV6503428.1 hypothetical protein [Fimbriimonadales bacterium]MCE7900254.1 hypothetical protein [Armatimonadetes bacterium ATM1]MDL1928410.1 hypothetical protein [Fimbriimonadia bacterium ATM]MBC6969972.1 hypothetical protein [Armatimonadota bacterium]